MFILRVVDKYEGYNYIIGYSECQAKLEDMIEQFKSATHSLNGKLLDFEDCPGTIEFGNILLTKDYEGFRCYNGIDSYNNKLVISYGDVLEVEEVYPI